MPPPCPPTQHRGAAVVVCGTHLAADAVTMAAPLLGPALRLTYTHVSPTAARHRDPATLTTNTEPALRAPPPLPRDCWGDGPGRGGGGTSGASFLDGFAVHSCLHSPTEVSTFLIILFFLL
ncbi:hypothetical protein Pcinc_014080 [Petrolisthes cinctipes]|uniref:Uncharacterized protein n=1 Tax=Petrolisthes cinctipes TaxID=88211 RepID=A0AAE1FXL7_PETCI|nr:hypothetical protein Pcinc_014080 [Petrolisthes cinctipes]